MKHGTARLTERTLCKIIKFFVRLSLTAEGLTAKQQPWREKVTKKRVSNRN